MNGCWTRVLSAVFATLFLAAVTLKTPYPGNDPYRCRAVQNTGRWIDPVRDEQGNRDPFRQWQPDGCILSQYGSGDIRRCMEGRKIFLSGDSTSQNVARAMGNMLDSKQFKKIDSRKGVPRIQLYNTTYHGQKIQRLANNIDKYTEERHNIPSIKDQQGPALIYISAGAWFTHPHVLKSCNETNVTDPWDKRYGLFRNHVVSLNRFIGDNIPDHDPFRAPMDPYDGIGNLILYAPPAGPRYLGDDPAQQVDRDRRANEVFEMQQWLQEHEGNLSIPLVWSIPGVVAGQDKIWRDPLRSGFHVKFHVAELRANILFNMRCNAKLDRMMPYPYSRTCCTDYGIKPSTQTTLVGLGLMYLTICVFCELFHIFTNRPQDYSHRSLFNMRTGCLVLTLLMCYYADRTQMMAKGSKLWQLGDFVALCLPCIAICLSTIRRSDPPWNLSFTQSNTDQPFLSPDQIDEWKGWMQVFILIYHWAGAQGGLIHVLVRLCMGAYVFQTGYVHTLDFMNEKDFSFNHAASTLLRLNILPCLLAYFMDTEYMAYHFSPLLSFWFLVVYATMAIDSGHNNELQFLLVKICVSCMIISIVFLATPFTSWTFYIFQGIFKIQWSAEEWQRSVTLDLFIAYVGMLAAVIGREMKKGEVSVRLGLRVCLVFGGLFSILHYLSFTSNITESSYMKWHPYVSVIPILGFVMLRNIPWSARN
ncbi:hypothetical protein FPSE_05486 [Fusarium pseudograminearum CS3096]|uniref:Cas1p 10 TM acyl transferase domain-containing protein n=1 Tax=Fusarium pseudograminearum (strain CS3096) TaxID=1028729 RepID=K3W0L1_FUSPC|nr:hypothetical protein FPSE_05486 [Fusarium pseudograminearum CS3096]EKJ74340.1 hypothetical protein FPSE_05486 [Fusarium pseudograminearum CS3096]